MNEREWLIELIASGVCEAYSPTCDEWQPHHCGGCYANNVSISEIADHLIANGVTVQKWIPVTDPPEKDGIYLVMGVDGLQYVESYGDIFGNGKRVWTRRWTTHWMPLPPPPKEG
jgi:hypothetical protein